MTLSYHTAIASTSLANLAAMGLLGGLSGFAILSFFWTTTRATSAAGEVSLQKRNIREKLPNDLDFWRAPGRKHEDEERIWEPLHAVFRKAGLTPWPVNFPSMLKSPTEFVPSSGFGYAISSKGVEGTGGARRLGRFMYTNALTRVMRTRDGHDVTVRVLVVRNEGHDHLKILRNIAMGPRSLFSDNHTLPLLSEFQFEDIIFGLFPLVGGTMECAFGYWPKNSVGDVLDMLLQALEALAFIHASNIAHRDAFHDNFLVQWQPESMLTMTVPVSRPRVYLIDFEAAVEFPAECSPVQRISRGYPLGASFPDPRMYSRPLAPEITNPDHEYCPFKLDVWQLGTSFKSFRTTIQDIDEGISDLRCPDPELRMNAHEALERLGKLVHAMPPISLLIEPQVIESMN